jgi:hypothetical protein
VPFLECDNGFCGKSPCPALQVPARRSCDVLDFGPLGGVRRIRGLNSFLSLQSRFPRSYLKPGETGAFRTMAERQHDGLRDRAAARVEDDFKAQRDGQAKEQKRETDPP